MNDNSEVGFIMIGGTEHMDEKRNWQSKIAGIFLILLGYFLGGNAPKTGYCYGDRVFEFLGLPAWTEEKQGMGILTEGGSVCDKNQSFEPLSKSCPDRYGSHDFDFYGSLFQDDFKGWI